MVHYCSVRYSKRGHKYRNFGKATKNNDVVCIILDVEELARSVEFIIIFI
jgi:hypothetical protein